MKKKIIISSIICFAVAAFVTSYSVLSSSNSLIMANLQALSTDEEPVDVPCVEDTGTCEYTCRLADGTTKNCQMSKSKHI